MEFACPWIRMQVTQRVSLGCWLYGHPIFCTVIIFLVQACTKQQASAQSMQKYLVHGFPVWRVVLIWIFKLNPDISTALHTVPSYVGISPLTSM